MIPTTKRYYFPGPRYAGDSDTTKNHCHQSRSGGHRHHDITDLAQLEYKTPWQMMRSWQRPQADTDDLRRVMGSLSLRPRRTAIQDGYRDSKVGYIDRLAADFTSE